MPCGAVVERRGRLVALVVLLGDPRVLLLHGDLLGLLPLRAPAHEVVLELLAGARRTALPLDQAVAELNHGGVELVAERGRCALELVQLVRRPVGGDIRASDRQQADEDVGLADGTVGEDLLLRCERVPHRRLGRGIDECRDGGRLRLAVALGDDAPDRGGRDPRGEQPGREDRDEEHDAGVDRRPRGARGEPGDEIVPPLHARRLPVEPAPCVRGEAAWPQDG